METLGDEQQQQQQQSTTANPSSPTEIIEEILTRLPVKSLLRFRSVSKQWLSHISTPSFSKLHFTCSTRTALFISAFDECTSQNHLLTASCDGGPVTHLLTIDGASFDDKSTVEHLNGLVLFSCVKWPSNYAYAYLLNPTTRKFLLFPHPYTDNNNNNNNKENIRYFFGFDESRNEHKILMFRIPSNHSTTFEIMVFSMLTYSWRKIDAVPPVGFTWDCLHFCGASVCVNSVLHLMFMDNLSFYILAFDLRTLMFSVINVPRVVIDDHMRPFLRKINGCVAVVFQNDRCLMENNEIHIWILQDYENRVWVKEIVTFPEPWYKLGCSPYPIDSINMDEIMFCSGLEYMDMLCVLVYNKKSRSFKSLQFTSGHQFSISKPILFHLIKCYVESMLPL